MASGSGGCVNRIAMRRWFSAAGAMLVEEWGVGCVDEGGVVEGRGDGAEGLRWR